MLRYQYNVAVAISSLMTVVSLANVRSPHLICRLTDSTSRGNDETHRLGIGAGENAISFRNRAMWAAWHRPPGLYNSAIDDNTSKCDKKFLYFVSVSLTDTSTSLVYRVCFILFWVICIGADFWTPFLRCGRQYVTIQLYVWCVYKVLQQKRTSCQFVAVTSCRIFVVFVFVT